MPRTHDPEPETQNPVVLTLCRHDLPHFRRMVREQMAGDTEHLRDLMEHRSRGDREELDETADRLAMVYRIAEEVGLF